MNEPCNHCGRTDSIKGIRMRDVDGQRATELLCHANPDGTKSDPDCYHLVTVYGEELGTRKKEGNGDRYSNPTHATRDRKKDFIR